MNKTLSVNTGSDMSVNDGLGAVSGDVWVYVRHVLRCDECVIVSCLQSTRTEPLCYDTEVMTVATICLSLYLTFLSPISSTYLMTYFCTYCEEFDAFDLKIFYVQTFNSSRKTFVFNKESSCPSELFKVL